jgi:hypothetical protein
MSTKTSSPAVSYEADLSKFATGAVRSSDKKGVRYGLISPIGMRRLAETYAEGAGKYGDCNWELGMPISDIMDHVIAHCYSYLAGNRGEDDLAHAAWGLFAAMHMEEIHPELQGNLRGPGCKLTADHVAEIKAANAKRIADQEAAKPSASQPVYPRVFESDCGERHAVVVESPGDYPKLTKLIYSGAAVWVEYHGLGEEWLAANRREITDPAEKAKFLA